MTETIQLLLDLGADINGKDVIGSTALLKAVEQSDLIVVRFLLDRGVDVNAADGFGRSPLFMSIIRFSFIINPDVSVLKLLIEKGANLNAKMNGYTPLLWALKQKGEEMAVVLISVGANVNAKDEWSNTALHLAVGTADLDLVQELLVKGLDVNAKNKSGQTPLMLSHDRSTVSTLLSRGALINVQDNDGQTPLMYVAAWGDDSNPVQILLEGGAHINVRDNDGRMPLMHAAKRGKSNNVRRLLEHGARANEKDSDGNTALALAAALNGAEIFGKAEVIRLLKKADAK